MIPPPPRGTLILGYGNPGRGDDGLGPALVTRLAAQPRPGVTLESRYQLAVEDAWEVSCHERVIFLDASRTARPPFEIQPLTPGPAPTFTSHALPAPGLLRLARDLYGRAPQAWMLAIRGQRFELGEGLGAAASRHLEAAQGWLLSWLDGPATTATTRRPGSGFGLAEVRAPPGAVEGERDRVEGRAGDPLLDRFKRSETSRP